MSDFIEERYKEGFTVRFDVKKRLFEANSPFQKVEIVESTHHGRMLFNDGCAMLSDRDEAIYHEMMAHVPLFTHNKVERVLIIGGGDGGTAREVLRHKSVKECVLVEIDGAVIEGSRKFLPKTAESFRDPRLRIVVGDGVKYVAEETGKFDVVMVDSTDPVGPAAPLFGPEFYGNVKQRLNAGGAVVAQGETPFYEPEAQKGLFKLLRSKFQIALPYNFTNMIYPGGFWSFFFASDELHPGKDFDPRRIEDSGLDFFYYNADIHRASLALPTFQRRQLGLDVDAVRRP